VTETILRDRPLRANRLFDLTGRTALVTGASRGIAAGIASVLAENGATVCINYASSIDVDMGFCDAAETLRASLVAKGCDVSLLDLDLSTRDAPARVHEMAENLVGPLDILVLSASVQVHETFLSMRPEDTERQIQLNLISPIRILQAILPGMLDRKYGRVLTIGSVQETVPSPEMPVYSATKAAQLNLVQNLAAQCASRGVFINNLSPGLIETDRNAFKRKNPEAWAENVRLANPMHRAGLPSDLLGSALLLCSDAASFVTGANLQVTGGAHVPVPMSDIHRSRDGRLADETANRNPL
jgi:NAD(P)-dependent dehydrogenase (short-subunit alcohol dehydrogenase family)